MNIKFSGEPIEILTEFMQRISKILNRTQNVPLNQKTIFEGKLYSQKSELTQAILFSFSVKHPELACKFYKLAETKNMNREIAIQIKSISPLWYQTVMEYFEYGKPSEKL